jgi:energy-coupling factor transport system substrate-specific component
MDNVRSTDGEAGRGDALMAWKTREVVVAAALAVPLGFVYAGWLTAWTAAQVLPEISHFLGGVYVIAGVLAAYVIRRPGAALLAEMIAALVETPLSPFGLIILWLGLLQALGTEAVFAATRYRRFDLPILMLAGVVGALAVLFGRFYVAFGYANLAIEVQAIRLVAVILGGALFGGLGAKLIGDALVRTGVLNNFPIARDRVREV